MNLLADVYEHLQEIRELYEDPPRGYTTEETLERVMGRLKELAHDADGLQMELAVEYDELLDVVEARMHAQLDEKGA